MKSLFVTMLAILFITCPSFSEVDSTQIVGTVEDALGVVLTVSRTTEKGKPAIQIALEGRGKSPVALLTPKAAQELHDGLPRWLQERFTVKRGEDRTFWEHVRKKGYRQVSVTASGDIRAAGILLLVLFDDNDTGFLVTKYNVKAVQKLLEKGLKQHV